MKQSENAWSKKKCIPCSAGTPAIKGKELQHLIKELGNGWKVVEEHHLEKEYTFPDFRKALTFTNKIGELAEREGHHPTSTWHGAELESLSGRIKSTVSPKTISF